MNYDELREMVEQVGMVATVKMLRDIAKGMAKKYPAARSCHNADARLLSICGTAIQANFEHNVMRGSKLRT